MADRKKYKKILIILIVLNLLTISVISISIYNNTLKKREFNQTLSKADLSIDRNSLSTAESLLKKIMPFAVSRNDYLKLLKRAFVISGKTADYDLLLAFSGKAFDRYPGELKFFNIYVYSLFKNKQSEKAAFLLDKYSGYDVPESLSSLIYTTVYRTGGKKEYLEKIKDLDIVSILEGQRDPEKYYTLYQKSEKPSSLTNYALSLLGSGKYGNAYEVLKSSEINDEINRELEALIYYDSENYRDSETILMDIYEKNTQEADPGILMMLADVYMKQINYKDALTVYSLILYRDREYSWIPYINTDWINMKEGIESGLTEEAVKIFTGDSDLLFLSLLKSRKENADKEREKYISGNQAINPDSYISEFWDYYNNDKMSHEFKIFFAKELYRMKRFKDLGIFTQKSTNRETDWSLFFKATTGFSERKYEQAFEDFQKYYKNTENWVSLYNMGLIKIISNDFDSARDLFRGIIEKSVKGEIAIRDEDLADIYLMISYTGMQMGMHEEAERYIDLAIKSGSSTLLTTVINDYYGSYSQRQ